MKQTDEARNALRKTFEHKQNDKAFSLDCIKKIESKFLN